jgi:hypothetical protein
VQQTCMSTSWETSCRQRGHRGQSCKGLMTSMMRQACRRLTVRHSWAWQASWRHSCPPTQPEEGTGSDAGTVSECWEWLCVATPIGAGWCVCLGLSDRVCVGGGAG